MFQYLALLTTLFLCACASVFPKQAIRVAQPDNGPTRNFTSFTQSLTCMDDLLISAKRPRILVSSTGFPDFSEDIDVGADEMLINAVSRMNRKSQAYVFLDQSREKGFGQLELLRSTEDTPKPRYYIRAAITQADNAIVSDSGSADFDFTNAPTPFRSGDKTLRSSSNGAGRTVAVVSVDMHLVRYPSKEVVPGSSVANTMVVVSNTRSFSGSGLIKLTGLQFDINISRVESMGQAVRNLVELGTIELLGRHARIPYWQCLNIRQTNQKLDNLDDLGFSESPKYVLKVQEMLTFLGYFAGKIDGKKSPTLRSTVAHFQADEKLIATGDINYHTYLRLRSRVLGYDKSRQLVSSNPTSSKSHAVALQPNKSSYRKGDSLGLKLAVKEDGYVEPPQKV